jgi:hypothetical protein
MRKTPLTTPKKYVVEGYSSKHLQNRSIWFEEYCQTVDSKTIGEFTKLYASVFPNVLLTPTCGSSIQKALTKSSRTTILALESGGIINKDEYIYLQMLLSNL